jgi:hypothetical protein
MKGLKNTIGEALAPILTALSNTISGMLGTWNQWADSNPVLARTITELVTAFGLLILAGGIWLKLGPLIISTCGGIGAAVDLMTGPIGWAVLAVTTLAGAFLYLTNSADEANRKTAAAVKAQAANYKAALTQELADAKTAYAENLITIDNTYSARADELEKERQAKLSEVQSEQDIADRYYNWQLGKLGDLRDAAVKSAELTLEAAQKTYDAQRRAVEDQANDEIREINRVRDAQLAALQAQLDAMDKADLTDQKGQLEARKREIEQQLEVVQTEEKRQELLKEYADLDKDLAGIAKQEKKNTIQDQMNDIRTTAETDIKASQDRKDAEITRLNEILAAAQTTAETAKTTAETNFTEAMGVLQTAVLNFTPANIVDWQAQMTGQLEFQTQWKLDSDARIAAIDKEYNDPTTGVLTLLAKEKQAALDLQAAILATTTTSTTTAITAIENPPIPEGRVLSYAEMQHVYSKHWSSEYNAAWLANNQGLVTMTTDFQQMLADMPGFKMASGGFGIAERPTLFLAGEAGPEPFAFGKAASQSMGMQAVVVNINGGIWTGNQADASRLGEFLNPIIRRQMRANTGEAQW